ncbi:MAG: CSLREA domain-containing protein, partial [Betaproteobacteria bacterium]
MMNVRPGPRVAISRWIVFTLLALTTSATLAATIVVNSAADVAANDGQCTLREAITSANTNTVSGALPGECAAG